MPLELTNQPPYYEIVDGPTPTPAVLYYIGMMNQASTNAPSVVILENTIGDIVWTYGSTGYYVGTLTGAFPELKLYMEVGIGQGTAGTQFQYGWNGSDDEIYIETTTIALAAADSRMSASPIYIAIYP